MKILLVFVLSLFSMTCYSDCFEMAGNDYNIDPDLLRAIAWKESKLKPEVIGYNQTTGYGSGLMQIDSQHFNELNLYGITPEMLLSDPCLNIYTGAYYLAVAFKKFGITWNAVGAYNAGFSPSSIQEERRKSYAKDVRRIYSFLKKKNTKNTHN
ncbi:transglycosylase SLT domain-containing protein [Citrobacter sp. wls826]|uniref:transglycosylase SLT domain-containing protein n=1 Tax=Citrobacter sp. wls826 TaxID=2576415 RepID=UPI0010C96F58|nr:transglycosylase SLT domain-containing protein [Citrobacter sp. wls826]TKU26100.1 lytic transglycosylase [Citrobacter sp. wls826]TKV30123.1 lytic transglycosylase [Citrobacter sp. TBCS-11]